MTLRLMGMILERSSTHRRKNIPLSVLVPFSTVIARARAIMRKKNVEATVDVMTVVLNKGTKGLGFTIAGGIGNQHIPGDNGIYVTKVMEGGTAAVDGRIDVGDRLVSILNFPTGEFVLDNCTHEDAVAGLKKCKDKVVLQVAKAEVPYASSPTIGQMQPMVGQYRMPTQTAMGVPREVTIQKGAAGLGFNIVGGEDGEGIFISFILPGGPADHSGKIYRGDKILGVNGIDLTQATHEAAADALKGAGGTINLRLLYCPGDYERFESKIHSIKGQVVTRAGAAAAEKSLFVRALFDNSSNQSLHGKTVPGQELKFSFGDILHIVHATDNDWWLARHINQLGQELATGIIPSRSCWEKIVASRGMAGHIDNGGGSGKWQQQKEDSVESEGKGILSYEVVQKREISYTRPVIVLGPLKDRINDELISEFPERFSSCVPHTTRPKRQFEVDGRDYHFVQSREQMERDIQNHKFIEAGQYNDNLYGTSIASVKDVAESGKHCILDVSGNAIRRLQAAQLFPVAVFVHPISPEFVRHLNGGALTEEQCKKSFARAKRLEEDFLQYFTATVRGDDFEDIYAKVKKLISVHSANKIWVPANETV